MAAILFCIGSAVKGKLLNVIDFIWRYNVWLH